MRGRDIFFGAVLGFVVSAICSIVLRPLLLSRISDAITARDMNRVTFLQSLGALAGALAACLVLALIAMILRKQPIPRIAALVLAGSLVAELLIQLNEGFSRFLLLRIGRHLPPSFATAHVLTRLIAPAALLLIALGFALARGRRHA